MSNPPRYRPRDVAARLLDPEWVAHEDADCLVVDLSDGGGFSPSDLGEQLASVPIPVIGFGVHGATPLANAMDVWVATDQELESVVTAIRARPVASAVLVQILRSASRLQILEALAVESLGYATLQGGREFAHWLEGRDSGARLPAPDEDAVLLTRCGDVLEIVLNAPHNRNALSVAMRDGLTRAFALVAMAPDIRSVNVRANGPSFSSGGDLTEFGTTSDPSEAHGIRMRRMPARYLAPQAKRYHFHVHGACVGAGIELAAFAGRLTADADAFFQLPEVAMGLIPGAGGCVSISRRIGRQRMAYMALSGRRIGVSEALAWGLIDEVRR